MASNRSIAVRLSAEVGQYKSAMAEAASSTRQVATEAEKTGSSAQRLGTSAEGAGRKSQSSFQSMLKSARENRAEWEMTGRTMLVAGTAMAGIGVAVLKTGIEYNTLQQRSRAALTTMLGSAQAAKTQMNALDEFARTSPFAKDVFIKAQQQMLAFGIETKKVIPYLDAVQNAVAAAGGSNNDIAEIVTVMSKIQSSAKITAVDLMQFGNHGVNAAELIGSQMGKTGAQIRADITNGTLDAGTALDALAAGMQQRYAGAADGVKNTMVGALDRVKAAWRDLASDLVTPLVDPNGGGMLVDWTNKLADFMRVIQKLPQPVKDAGVAIGGLATAGLLVGGAFLTLAPKVLEGVAAFNKIAPAGSKARGAIAGVGKAFAVFAISEAIYSAMIGGLEKDFQRLAVSADEAKVGLANIASGSTFDKEFGDQFIKGAKNVQFHIQDTKDAIEALANYKPPSGFVGFLDDIHVIDVVNPKAEEAKAYIGSLDAAFAELVASGNADAAAKAMGQLGLTAERQAEIFPEYTAALESNAASQQMAGEAAAEAAGKTGDLASWQAKLAAALEDPNAAIQKQAQEMQKWIDSMDGAAAAFVDWSAGLDDASYSLDGWLTGLEEQASALEAWSANIKKLADRGASKELMQQLIDLGPAGARAMNDLANGTDRDLARAEAVIGRTNTAALGLKETLGEKYVIDIDASGAESEANWAAKAIDTIGSNVDKWYIDADGNLAKREAITTSTMFNSAGSAIKTWLIDANGSKATAVADTVQSIINAVRLPAWRIDADGKTAVKKADTAKATISRMVPKPFQVGANTGPATATTSAWSRMRRTATIVVDANTGAAQAKIAALGNLAASIRAQVGLARGGRIPSYADGGRIGGTPPADPMVDNVLAVTQHGTPIAVRSGEWIQPQPAVDYYGDRAMAAIARMRIPRQVLAGYAGGGQPSPAPRTSAAYMTAPSVTVAPAVYVQNPWTGEYMQARMASTAAAAAGSVIRERGAALSGYRGRGYA